MICHTFVFFFNGFSVGTSLSPLTCFSVMVMLTTKSFVILLTIFIRNLCSVLLESDISGFATKRRMLNMTVYLSKSRSVGLRCNDILTNNCAFRVSQGSSDESSREELMASRFEAGFAASVAERMLML